MNALAKGARADADRLGEIMRKVRLVGVAQCRRQRGEVVALAGNNARGDILKAIAANQPLGRHADKRAKKTLEWTFGNSRDQDQLLDGVEVAIAPNAFDQCTAPEMESIPSQERPTKFS